LDAVEDDEVYRTVLGISPEHEVFQMANKQEWVSRGFLEDDVRECPLIRRPTASEKHPEGPLRHPRRRLLIQQNKAPRAGGAPFERELEREPGFPAAGRASYEMNPSSD
jgi:hypothetical protein